MFKISPQIGLFWESEHNNILTVTKDKTKQAYFARSMTGNANLMLQKKTDTAE